MGTMSPVVAAKPVRTETPLSLLDLVVEDAVDRWGILGVKNLPGAVARTGVDHDYFAPEVLGERRGAHGVDGGADLVVAGDGDGKLHAGKSIVDASCACGVWKGNFRQAGRARFTRGQRLARVGRATDLRVRSGWVGPSRAAV